ncbi:hypothetical protein JZ900_04160 [Riemerella anatipestifer]|nr:hypothetical protein [Riemerella anatipestifer]OBP64918.1 hypothetical protein AWM62_05075 [Riemerella anatipestifer]
MPLREGEGHCWSSSYKGVRDRCGLCKIATARRPTLEEALELAKGHAKKNSLHRIMERVVIVS